MLFSKITPSPAARERYAAKLFCCHHRLHRKIIDIFLIIHENLQRTNISFGKK